MGAAETTGGREPRVSDDYIQYRCERSNPQNHDDDAHLDLRDARTALAAKDARIAELEQQVADAERKGAAVMQDTAARHVLKKGHVLGSVTLAESIMRLPLPVGAAMPAAAKDEVQHG